MIQNSLFRPLLRARCLLYRLGFPGKAADSMRLEWDPEIAVLNRREAVHTVLKLIRRTLGLRIALVTKLSGETFTACAVLDEAGYGLQPGDKLETTATFCSTVCGDGNCPCPLIINQASADPRFRDHPALQRYGIESYIAVPLYRPDRSILGTLCALDSKPSRLTPEDLDLLRLFSQLITSELQSEEEMELLHRTEQFQSEFLGILSHDLRNPLTAIKLSTLTLKDSPSADLDHRHSLALIEQNADRMNRMIRDLLDFTRSRLGGDFPIRKERADLHDLCFRVIQEYKVLYPNRTIRFDLAGMGEGECDPERMLQVLSNLISNALHHSPEEAAVEVRVSDSGGGIVLEIYNGGPPIPPDLLSVIFQPFVRGDEREGGVGLGLYIVDQIVRAHGGLMEVESSAETGTTFRVRLSAANAATG